MDSFVFCCEHCGKSIKADVSDRGAQAGCPYCGKQITIPQAKTVRITNVIPRNDINSATGAEKQICQIEMEICNRRIDCRSGAGGCILLDVSKHKS